MLNLPKEKVRLQPWLYTSLSHILVISIEFSVCLTIRLVCPCLTDQQAEHEFSENYLQTVGNFWRLSCEITKRYIGTARGVTHNADGVVPAQVSAILTRNSEEFVRKNVISYVSVLCDCSPACGQGKAVYMELKYRAIQNHCRGFNNLSHTIHLR